MLSRARVFSIRMMALAVLVSAVFVLSIAATSSRAGPSPLICEPPRTAGSSNTAAGGSDIPGLTLASLTQRSEAVLFGVVTELQSCLDQGFTFTLVSVQPEETIADRVGNVRAAASIKLRIAGGTYGGYTLGVSTSPEFSIGERIALFLRRDARHYLYPAGGSFGKLTLGPGEVVQSFGISKQQLKEKILKADAGALPSAEDPLTARETVETSFAPFGAKWPSFRLPVSLQMNPETNRPPQLTTQQTRLASLQALHAWQNLSDSYIAFGPYANTGQPSRLATCANVNPTDGIIRTTWGLVDPPGQAHPSGVLGVTYICGDGSGIGHAEVQLENDDEHTYGARWRVNGQGTCDGYFDLVTVLVHEYGHALGLGHPSQNSGCNNPCPVLDATYGGVSRTPCSDDQTGAAYLYPISGTPPGPPSGLAAVRGASVQLSWTGVSGELGYEIWRAALPCGSALPNDFSLLDSVGPSAATYNDNAYGGGLSPSQTYCYKVRSFNQGGVSAFSSSVQAGGSASATPTITPTPSPSPTATPGPSPSPTATPSPTPTTTPTLTPSPTATATVPAILKGDVDCDGQIDAVDALLVLRFVAALGPFATCIQAGEVNCDAALDAVDALHILRFVAGLSVSLREGCAPMGQ